MAKCYEQRGSMTDIKKIEIIERITDFNGAVIENTLTSWDHFYVKESVEDIFAYELEIYPRERRIRKKQKDIYLTYCEFEILYTTLQLFHKKNIVQDFLMYNEFDPKHYKGK